MNAFIHENKEAVLGIKAEISITRGQIKTQQYDREVLYFNLKQ
jgi:hypothetical protein